MRRMKKSRVDVGALVKVCIDEFNISEAGSITIVQHG
jgi:hypothetical protein